MGFLTASKINSMKKSFREGDYNKALSYAEKLAPADVHTSYDLSLMADLYLEKKRYAAARDVFAEMYKRTQSTRLCKQLIDLSIRLNDIENALKYLAELKELDDEDYERFVFQYRIGKILGESDEYLLENLKRVREADYIDVWALELAKLYFKTGQTQECLKECKNIILWFPDTDYSRKAGLLAEACEEGKTYADIAPVRQAPVISNDDDEDDDSDEYGNVIIKKEPEEDSEDLIDDEPGDEAPDEASENDEDGDEELLDEEFTDEELSEEEPDDDENLTGEDVPTAVDADDKKNAPKDELELVPDNASDDADDDEDEVLTGIEEEEERSVLIGDDEELPEIVFPDLDEPAPAKKESLAEPADEDDEFDEPEPYRARTERPGRKKNRKKNRKRQQQEKGLAPDDLADEVMRALRVHEESGRPEDADAVDESIMKMIAEEDKK